MGYFGLYEGYTRKLPDGKNIKDPNFTLPYANLVCDINLKEIKNQSAVNELNDKIKDGKLYWLYNADKKISTLVIDKDNNASIVKVNE